MKQGIFSAFILIFWAGFVSSISFMESWLKFTAAGITLPLGLTIGKLVFHSLNIMEWVFLVLFFIFRFFETSVSRSNAQVSDNNFRQHGNWREAEIREVNSIEPLKNKLLTKSFRRLFSVPLMIVTAFLSIQTFWLLPELNERADLIISGINPPHSAIHLLYPIVEVSKVILLIFVAWGQIRRSVAGDPI